MTIEDMHYDFKKKLNKGDSQQYKNLLIPEIDWVLNEAQSLLLDMIAQPRLSKAMGFERFQKNTDDIYPFNTEQCYSRHPLNDVPLILFPEDYRYWIKGSCTISKGTCTNKKATLYMQQQDDEFEVESFYDSSFIWRHVNGIFDGTIIKIITDGSFNVDEVCIKYLRNPIYMHNAKNYRGGTYTLPSGTVLTGTQDSEFPIHMRREIVDLAVLITTGEIQAGNYQEKIAKIQLNNLK